MADMARTCVYDRRARVRSGYEYCRALVEDIGERPAGLAGEKRGADYIAGELRKMGLSDVRLERYRCHSQEVLGCTLRAIRPDLGEVDAWPGIYSGSTPRGGLSSATAAPNWWHASGHESGRWAAADNRHGDIGLFHGKTTRTYGSGRHPEEGSDRGGQQVIFASHMLGNVDVCGNNPGEVAAGMGKTILAI